MGEQEYAQVIAVLRDLHEHQKQAADLNDRVAQMRIDVNKQVISFFERLLLLDLGVLGLSVNVLIALLPRLPQISARKTFSTGVLIAAWVLLLVSAYFCTITMRWSIHNNRKVLRRLQKTIDQLLGSAVMFDLNRLARVMGPDNSQVKPETRALFESIVERARKSTQEFSAEESKKFFFDPFAKRHRLLKPPTLAVNCMQVALSLLCILAIRMILAH